MSTSFSLQRPERRPRGASILPLINVVFLLLMFIVVAGVIRSPDPFALTPTQAGQGEDAGAIDPDTTLFVSVEGGIRFRQTATEDAALAEITRLASAGELTLLTVRADARAPAADIVQLVEALRETGLEQVQLQSERRP